MKKSNIAVIALGLFALFTPSTLKAVDTETSTQALSLTVDARAMIKVVKEADGSTGGSIALSLAGATEAGAAPTTVGSDATTRLRVTSSTTGATTRTITAQCSVNMYTANHTELLVQFADPVAFQPVNTQGGSSTGATDISDGVAGVVVTGITNCYSGTTNNSGYLITYTFQKSADFTTGFTSPGNVTITYTITDEL